MERDWQDFKSLHSNYAGARDAFEKACETLFRKLYPNQNVKIVKPNPGDKGIDIFVGNYGTEPILVIQCKFFIDKFGKTQLDQIKSSFKRTQEITDYEMKEWILSVPKELTNKEHKLFADWKLNTEREYGLDNDFIKLKSGNELIDLMKELDLYNQIFKIKELNLIKDTNTKVTDLHNKFNTQNELSDEIKPKIYTDSNEASDALWNLLKDEFIFDAKTMSINFRGILLHSKHSKNDFAKLLGIEIQEFEKYLFGEKIPSLDILFRLSKITNLEMKFFFTPNFYGSDYLIQNDLIRYSILKNIKPEKEIGNINNVNKFIGSVLYQIADKIVYLYEIITNNQSAWREYPQDLTKKFIGELAHQYYKLLEQVPNYRYNDEINKDYNKGFTSQELIIQKINAQIIVETIRKIKISETGEPIVITHFDEEIKKKSIYGRTYDDENLKMIFSKNRKIQIQ